jgi:pSer/pThr/pTyr-binding forkhead associated (FHA) protein
VPITLLVRSTASTHAPPALTFDGARIVIGRGQGCDVRLPDPSVSHRHATIRVDGGRHALVDEGSTNGTFVGGVRLATQAPRTLRTGDFVRVGRVWLEVRIDQTPPTHDLALATRELALMLVSQAMERLGDDVVARVRVVEGPDMGAELALAQEGRAYVVGRAEECDLSVADADASREHVQIVRRGPTVLARDLGSKNGALLGESRLGRDRDVVWRSALMLRLGQTVLALEEPVARALGALEDAIDEPMGAGDAPPAPPTRAATDPDPEPAVSSASPASVAASAAPIAQVISSKMGEQTLAPRRSGWSATDLAVVAAAVAVIAMSIAGLVWLLK